MTTTAQDQLFEVVARELIRRHADHLRNLGPVRVLALDPCPSCMGRVVASETVVRCACGWSYRPTSEREPVASRRVDS